VYHITPAYGGGHGLSNAGVVKALGRHIVGHRRGLGPREMTCFWHLIQPTWQSGSWTYESSSNHHQLHVPDDSGRSIRIPQLEVSEACKMLGVRLAPDGNNVDELAYLHQSG